jgi:hypothetical protein
MQYFSSIVGRKRAMPLAWMCDKSSRILKSPIVNIHTLSSTESPFTTAQLTTTKSLKPVDSSPIVNSRSEESLEMECMTLPKEIPEPITDKCL